MEPTSSRQLAGNWCFCAVQPHCLALLESCCGVSGLQWEVACLHCVEGLDDPLRVNRMLVCGLPEVAGWRTSCSE